VYKRQPGGWGELPRAGQACQPPAHAGHAWGARPRGAMAAPRPRERGSAWLVAARCPPRSRRAAVFPAFCHDNGKLSTWYHSSKIHHIFVRLPTKFGVIPSWFLFFMNFCSFNGWKIKINTSRFLKILKQILQLDWIFPNLCAKFQLQIIFFLGFRGGGPAGT